MEWVKFIFLQYPSNTLKYTTSNPYWIQNILLLDIIFCIHNNLNLIIKILITINLSLTVLFPSVPFNFHHGFWVHKPQKFVHETEKISSTSNTCSETKIRLLVFFNYQALYVCLKGNTLADRSRKRKFNPRRYYICSSKI